MSKEKITFGSEKLVSQSFYTLPLRDMVVFPQMTTTVLVGREKSLRSIREARNLNLPIFVISQLNADNDEFSTKSLHRVGTLCNIVEISKAQDDGTLKVVMQGLIRAKLNNIIDGDENFFCEVDLLMDQPFDPGDKDTLGLIKSCIEDFRVYSSFNKKINPDVLQSLTKIRSPHEITYLIATYINTARHSKQEILNENDLSKRLYKLLEILKLEIEIYKSEERINKTIQEKFVKGQKEMYLIEQMKNIKKELGQDDDSDVEEIKKKLEPLKLPKEVRKKCEAEIKKLEKMNPYSAESGVVRSYLDWISNLPWSKKTKLTNDIKKSEEILSKNHYALDKVKERIIEFIAVQMKTKESKGPILCLVGPPGVGKTSLAKSIAESLNRKYVKMSLGGVRDESEIRGHRRTYIGSMPGRIIQSMKKAETINPLMLLDEIDKISSDFRGDPASALLEVLDPEQNANFSDHYIEVEYDLSKVMFVATANNINAIPIPLRDRMEIIRLSGYTENEKLEIAKSHLISKQLKENGLKKDEFRIEDTAILELIRRYTFEAGVRNLNREIANLARKAAKSIVTKDTKSVKITTKNLGKYAGVPKKDFGSIKKKDLVGVSTGLAYTEYGGDLLNIEALKFEGSGKIQITGQLGDVMKESAQTALSYARSIAKTLKVEPKKFNKYDFHIHVPEGATPKDGPSAGIALCLALVSVVTGKSIKKDLAMTGEITLTGNVLAIGGLKEKLLAAVRGKVKTVIIPEANKKDLVEMPKEVLDNLNIETVSRIEEVLKIGLTK